MSLIAVYKGISEFLNSIFLTIQKDTQHVFMNVLLNLNYFKEKNVFQKIFDIKLGKNSIDGCYFKCFLEVYMIDISVRNWCFCKI